MNIIQRIGFVISKIEAMFKIAVDNLWELFWAPLWTLINIIGECVAVWNLPPNTDETEPENEHATVVRGFGHTSK